MLVDGTSFAITVVADTPPAVLRLSGELDADSASDLLAQGQSVIDAGHRHVVIDCEDLLFCDSYGLRAIMELWHLVQPDGTIVVAGASDQLIKILQVTGLAGALGVGDHP